MTAPSNDLDCRSAARRLHELLDRELTRDQQAAVRRHLESCADCMAVFEFEQAFKRFLALRASSSGAPQGLKQRVLTQLHAAEQPPES